MKQNTLKISLLSITTLFGFQSQTMEPTSLNHIPDETIIEIAKNLGNTKENISNLARTNAQCYAALEQPSFIKWSATQFLGKYRKTESSWKYRQINKDILQLCANSKNGYDRALYEKLSQKLFFDPNRIGKIPYGLSSPITASSSSSNLELVESLLKKGANPNLVSGLNGDTPITAVLKANFDEEISPDLSTKQQNIIRSLVKSKANINYATPANRTLLDIALDNNSKDHIPTLINCGIDPNYQGGYSRETPLNKIIKSNYMHQKPENAEIIVVSLLKAGADPLLKNNNGQDAFACCRNNPRLTKLIKDNSKKDAAQRKKFLNI